MNGFYNVSTVDVDSEGDHFTQHGLDLNRKGKNRLLKQLQVR